MATRLVSVLGLAFGDCGKGAFIDALARRWSAHTVVRFNGGGQAGHNVVLPDGRHHTFSQFGAATFVPGVLTLLTSPVVVHPGALLVEHDILKRAGVPDALGRLLIDARCRVTTPFHQAAGRLRELERQDAAHGSCGVGFGETVGHALRYPQQAIVYGDLADPALALAKAEAVRTTLLAQWARAPSAAGRRELQVLADADLSRRWLAQIAPLLAQVAPAGADAIYARFHRPGTLLFEGAQGVLLDEARGFHPHTTWSSISTAAVEAVARDAGQGAPIEHYGALRSYLTRHGAGPLPTHDARLDRLAGLAEAHNGDGGWQGPFRRGHPDALLLRYALAAVGKLDGLLVSHLDVFARAPMLRWCRSYRIAGQDDTALIGAIVPGRHGDLAHQARLTAMLAGATPCYEAGVIASAAQLVDELAALSGLPVRFGARGPSYRDIGPG
ncbi:MAG: adenylosuccinate synthase [Massilia sp.]|nr:adenylosuccinate synthase [Massilia sp.]